MNNNINMNFFPPLPQDLVFEPFLVDDWLQTELEQSGLMLKQDDLLFQQQQQQQQDQVSTAPPSTRRLVPIMPKSSSSSAISEYTSTLFTHPSSCLGLSGPPSPPYSVSSTGTGTTITAKRKSIDGEPEDVLIKRQRNTDAARRSRLKKMHKMETLEVRVADLESENAQLNTRVAVLESEKSGLEAKDKEMQLRIQKLEEQLREAHRALGSKLTK